MKHTYFYSTLLVLASTFIMACSSAPAYKWQPPASMTDQEMRKAWYECQRDAEMLYAQRRPGYAPPQGNLQGTLMYGAIQSGAQDASAGLFENCLYSRGFQKVPVVQTAGTTGPNWLNSQRILDESNKGKQIKKELQEFVAMRQKQIDNREDELRNLEEKLKAQNPRSTADEQAFRAKLADYQDLVKKLNMEVESKRSTALSAFDKMVQTAASQVNQRSTLPDDPNLAVIRILDNQ